MNVMVAMKSLYSGNGHELERTNLSRSLSPSLSTAAGDASSNGEEDDSVPGITRSVIFKCIGLHKEMEYQDMLAVASRNRDNGKTIRTAQARARQSI